MEKDTKKHYLLYTDYRMQSLEIVLEGLDHSSKTLSDKVLNSIGFLDPSDTEFYYGVRYLAIQNYLKYTTSDLCQVFNIKDEKLYKFHSITDKMPGHEYNTIQLINSCADYFKHKDEKISNYTKMVLMDFELYDEEKQYDDEYYLLTQASDYLKFTYNTKDTLILLSEWRQKVIEILSENYPIEDNPA